MSFTDDAPKIIKKMSDEELDKFLKAKKQEVIDLYFEFKGKLEKAVLLSDDKTKKPIIITVATGIYADLRIEKNKIIADISIVPISGSNVEKMILIAGWHGTAMGINKEIVNFIGVQSPGLDTSTLGGYYFAPSDADTLYYNQVERLLDSKR